jgi:hypothetical protein
LRRTGGSRPLARCHQETLPKGIFPLRRPLLRSAPECPLNSKLALAWGSKSKEVLNSFATGALRGRADA